MTYSETPRSSMWYLLPIFDWNDWRDNWVFDNKKR